MEWTVGFDGVHGPAKGQAAIATKSPVPHSKGILIESKGAIAHGSSLTYQKLVALTVKPSVTLLLFSGCCWSQITIKASVGISRA